jgi:hypothetical protein
MNEKVLYIGMPASFLLSVNPKLNKLPAAARQKLIDTLPKQTPREAAAWALYLDTQAKRSAQIKGKGYDGEKEWRAMKSREIIAKIYLLKKELTVCDQFRAQRIFVDLDMLGKELKKALPK